MSDTTSNSAQVKFSFGDSPELADSLLALVLAGKKTATCGALRDYEEGKEAMPAVGRRDIVLNGAGEEACVIETLSLETRRFDDIDPSFTDREGEGPYAQWRAEHEAFFARNGGFSPDMQIVCETFKLLSVLPAGRELYNRVARPIFIVTDIESDGPTPLHNSMLSFASVAIEADGTRHGEFEAVLKPRADRTQNDMTMDWWKTQPEAWKAATEGAEDASVVMPRFADWVDSLPGLKVFVAAPMIFDGLWMDHYLDEYADTRALSGPFKGRQIFRGGGVCLYTMAGTLRGAPYLDWGMSKLPAEFYGHIAHTHKAIDDARGFANVLVELFQLSSALPGITGSKSDFR
ncbi:ASCH domain-containing protein [Devosia sp. Root685]|uniref:ASCH domain-containing protein n=1 Tax=Devosia sp. Root685 TaxID=1736587 RepID=UPI0009E68094|nr:ASCH domain-containing protein [Devosia sp. Root685]